VLLSLGCGIGYCGPQFWAPLGLKQLCQARLVEADDHFVVYGDDRNTLLAGYTDHVHGSLPVGSDVLFDKGDSLPGQKLFGLVAIATRRCSIDYDIHSFFLIASHSITINSFSTQVQYVSLLRGA
jgi:hypothetical protein